MARTDWAWLGLLPRPTQSLPTAPEGEGREGNDCILLLRGRFTNAHNKERLPAAHFYRHLFQMKKPLFHTVSISTSSTHPTRAEQNTVFPRSEKLEFPQELKTNKSLSAGTFCKDKESMLGQL